MPVLFLFIPGASTQGTGADGHHREGGRQPLLEEVYRSAFNQEFSHPAREEGSAFVPFLGGSLDDVLCEQYERTMGQDHCIRFEGRVLQIPADRHRYHYVKAQVRVHRYTDGRLALFHGPRRLATYGADGRLAEPDDLKAAA